MLPRNYIITVDFNTAISDNERWNLMLTIVTDATAEA